MLCKSVLRKERLEQSHTALKTYNMKTILLLLALTQASFQIEHNLPEGVELVDPKSLGLDSQFDLDKLLGNVKLLPNSGKIDPKTGTKTQILTVGFEGEENINLDDFELPSAQGNNTELVSSAFESFRDYIKGGGKIPASSSNAAAPARKNVVMRRRKVVKATTERPTGPKVVELESSQIEKLLATGKLKSKKVGESQVIEITQEQLNELYAMENGGEFKELLGGATYQSNLGSQTTSGGSTFESNSGSGGIISGSGGIISGSGGSNNFAQTTTLGTSTTTLVPEVTTTTKTTTEGATKPPIIYQFNTKDFDYTTKRPFIAQPQYQQYVQQERPYINSAQVQQERPFTAQPQQERPFTAQPQQERPYVNSAQAQYVQPQYVYRQQQQQQHKVLKTPTYEFISVPPSSFSSFNAPTDKFRQDPLPRKQGQVLFPTSSQQNRFHRDLGLNTYFQGDGLNYKINKNNIKIENNLWGV